MVDVADKAHTKRVGVATDVASRIATGMRDAQAPAAQGGSQPTRASA